MRLRTSGYLADFFEDPMRMIERAISLLASRSGSFDAIAFRGMSGAMVAPVVAARLNKTLIMVRKDGDGSHSPQRVEGDCEAARYIILDDLISRGDTVRTIQKTIHDKFNPAAVCVGIALWHDDCILWRGELNGNNQEFYERMGVFVDFPPPTPATVTAAEYAVQRLAETDKKWLETQRLILEAPPIASGALLCEAVLVP